MATTTTTTTTKKDSCSYNLLVIASQRINYYQLFKDATVNGKKLCVEQCAWDDISACSYAEGDLSTRDKSSLVITIAPSFRPLLDTPQNNRRAFVPDFVLLRGTCVGGAHTNFMRILSTFYHSGCPSINSLESFYNSQNKAVLYGRLQQVKKKLGGFKEFPLIPMTCYSDWRAATFPPDVPAVAKVSSASGGLGKMKIDSAAHWDDFSSVAAMQSDFFTSEPFIKWDYDIRVQKIGSHYRAFKRTAKHWKSNVDANMHDEDTEVEERYKLWIDEASAACGMDICALDVIRAEDGGQEYILELNSSAIGLNGRHQDEDAVHIRELVLMKMSALFGKIDTADAPNATPVEQSSSSNEAEKLKTQAVSMQTEINHLYERLRELEKNQPTSTASSTTSDHAKSDSKKGKWFHF